VVFFRAEGLVFEAISILLARNIASFVSGCNVSSGASVSLRYYIVGCVRITLAAHIENNHFDTVHHHTQHKTDSNGVLGCHCGNQLNDFANSLQNIIFAQSQSVDAQVLSDSPGVAGKNLLHL